MICPYCDNEISESAVEAEDGSCPECGALLSALPGMGDDEDNFNDDNDNDLDDDTDLEDDNDFDDLDDEDFDLEDDDDLPFDEEDDDDVIGLGEEDL